MAFYNEKDPGNHFYSEANFHPATLAPLATVVNDVAKKKPDVMEELPQLAPSPYTKDTWSSGNVGGGGSGPEQRRQAAAEKADPKSWVNQTPEQKATFFSDNPGMLGFQTALTSLMSPYADSKILAETRGIIDRANQIIDAKKMGPPISAMNTEMGPPISAMNPVGALPVVANMESGQVGALPTTPTSEAPVAAPVAPPSPASYSDSDSSPAPAATVDHESADHEAKGGYIKNKPTLEDTLHYIMMRAK